MKADEPNEPAPIAIIGMGCLFPRADNLGAYWANICNRVDAITDVPPTHWRPEDYLDADPKSPDRVYAARGGFLSPVPFPPLEFGITPNTLEAIDTTQLLGLMAARQALDDAGYGAGREFDRNRVSVILGVTGTLELVIPLGARLGHPIWRRALKEASVADDVANDVVQRIADSYVGWQEDSFPGLLGNVAAGRIANRLDLGGTNCVVDAACASSLAALHLGMLELQAGRADMVLSGGLDTFNDIFMYMCFSKTPALSPTGNAKPFDANADGTILGEGLGILLLKRHADAVRGGDKIYAVIRGLGTSSDGKGNAIYAPSSAGQMKALRQAYRSAGVTPDTIELVEAHGTGTRAGDTAEAAALAEVYRATGKQGSWCALGSVKSQIGHTKAAAGVAGLIKAALALHHKVLPPTIKVEQPAEILAPGESSFYINTEERPWLPPAGHPRRAAVSSFGFGGSNYHCVLEESSSAKSEIAWDHDVTVATYSGSSRQELVDRLAGLLPESSWDEIQREASQSRTTFSHKAPFRVVLVLDRDRLLAHALERGRAVVAGTQTPPSGKLDAKVFFGTGGVGGGLAFLFPGQGSQYAGMLRDWACRFPQVHETLCDADFANATGQRLSDFIYPQSAFSADTRKANEEALRGTNVAQPALGAVSLGAARMLQHFGVTPAAVAGHSYGELVALHSAGVFDAKALHALSGLRGRLMDAVAGDRGAMMAVQATLQEVEAVLAAESLDLTMANRNAPRQFVLSGKKSEISRAEAAFGQRKLACRLLSVAAAFHSPLVAEVEQPFREALEQVDFRTPNVPIYANTTGKLYPSEPAQMRAMLAGQLARPVAFADEIEAMYRDGIRTFVEVGPGSKLSGLVRLILEGRPHATLGVDSTSGKCSACYELACVLAELAALGHQVDWDRWDEGDDTAKTQAQKKPTLTVPMCGSNYVKPRTTPERRLARERHKPAEVRAAPIVAGPGDEQTIRNGSNGEAPALTRSTRESHQRNSPAAQPPPLAPQTAAPAPQPPPQAGTALAQALRLSQDNLIALQKLGEQTAELHRQFLDGQDKVLQAFQAALEQQQSLIQIGLGASVLVLEPVAKVGEAAAPVPESARMKPRLPDPVVAAPLHSMATSATPSPPSAPLVSDASARILLEVVSEKTGYPPEMLELNMELDADLGIDSIKRVEIFSAVQERLPKAQVVKPEHVGALRTLQNVVDFLATANSADSALQLRSLTLQARQQESSEVVALLLAVVSEKTGYPVEMLELDMEVDSDLGIDSIKRVEIFSSLQERLPAAPVIKPEDVGALRTLRDIASFLQGAGPAAPAAPTIAKHAAAPPAPEPAESASTPLKRSVLCSRPLNANLKRNTVDALGPGEIWVSDDGAGLAECLVSRLGLLGHAARRVVLGESDALPTPDELAGLIIVSPPVANDAVLWDALRLAQIAGPALRRSRGAVFVTVSRLDGCFGLNSTNEPSSAGLAGLAKTAGHEWPEVRCKAIDLAAEFTDIDSAASALVDEMFLTGPAEIGIQEHGKTVLELEEAPLPANGTSLPVASGDVVLITGGARGVTAEVAVALAETVRPVLVLLGRNPMPVSEPAWLAGLSQESDIKRALAQRASATLSPRELAEQCRQILAQREIRGNLQRIADSGVKSYYRSVDIRDAAAVQALVAEVRANLGPICGVIHGAGVLADRRIEDKTREQFERVYQTKVDGLRNLLDAVEPEELKLLVLFSSTTARFGRTGQVDYAMANEVLNKLARREARRRPGCKVVAVNWGPWAGGMVTPALREVFEKEGVSLIPLQAGSEHLLREIGVPPVSNAVEVVVLAETPAVVTEVPEGSSLTPVLERDVSVADYPVLRSHVLDGKAVFPLALSIEWLAHGALHGNPGLAFHGFNELRVLKGVRLDADQTLRLRILAGKAQRKGNDFIAPAELCGITGDGRDLVYSRAEIVLADRLPASASACLQYGRPENSRSVEEIYDSHLFHGSSLRGLEQLHTCGPQGIVASACPAPAPAAWLRQPLRTHWLADPLILDVAFQLGIIWSQEQVGVPALPTYIRSYRQYCKSLPRESVRIVVAIGARSAHCIVADVEFLDSGGAVVARMEHCEWVVDASLREAFARRQLDGDRVLVTG